MEIAVNLKYHNYKIILEDGLLNHLKDYLKETDYFIITDENIPLEYVKKVSSQLETEKIITIKAGEASKSFMAYQEVLTKLYDLNCKRDSVLVALGGGVVGDLTGFVAATYLRGIKYISIPTTTLSQIDSSIGGKTGINFLSTKNMVGAFYHPELVLIDYEVLKTLPRRHYYNGLIEALKMGLISDSKLYQACLDYSSKRDLKEIIPAAIYQKKLIVEADEKEANLRKLLNLGHTFGHAFESYYNFETLYHGEAVLLGMLKIINNPTIIQQLKDVANRLQIPLDLEYDISQVMKYIKQDKKSQSDFITVILVDEVGRAYLKDYSFQKLRKLLEEK